MTRSPIELSWTAKNDEEFPKMRGGSKATWNSSKKSSVLEAPPVSYIANDDDNSNDLKKGGLAGQLHLGPSLANFAITQCPCQ